MYSEEGVIDMVTKRRQEDDELLLFRKSIQGFADKYIAPYYEEWEEAGTIPRELWRKLGEEGLLCIDIPEEYGGMGVPYRYASLVVEELTRLGFTTIAINITVHANIVAHYVLGSGTEEQKQYYLPKLASGEMVGAIAMTEPGAGSDLQGMKTTAVYDEATDTYRLSGSKTFITNGQLGDFIVVAAITDATVAPAKGTSLFILDDPETPGFARGKNLKKIGLHSCDTSELFFDDVILPASHILGEKNKGFITLMQELPRERLTLAVCAQGAMEGALEWTIQYIQEREAFKKKISDFQNTRFKIAEMQTKVRLHRAFVDECMTLIEQDALDTATASMAKLTCSEAQGEVVDGCLQLFGGYGYMTEYPISRAFVDARVQRIYGGTSEIMKQIIANDILGK